MFLTSLWNKVVAGALAALGVAVAVLAAVAKFRGWRLEKSAEKVDEAKQAQAEAEERLQTKERADEIDDAVDAVPDDDLLKRMREGAHR